MLQDFDPAMFWEDSDYARAEYIDAPVTDAVVQDVERRLGFKLPASYVAMMRHQNGGIPKRSCFPTREATSWAKDHIAVHGFYSIGHRKRHSLLGELGGTFMQEDWGYPKFGICICDCPSAGHDMVMLDYREHGPTGEPSVVHVDQESNFRVTFLARDFEAFIRGLVHPDVYDTSKAELEKALTNIRDGSFSTRLAPLIAKSANPAETEALLRALLRSIAIDKSYFALHGDPKSQLAYDVLFDLFAAVEPVSTEQVFLDAYRDLLALGDGAVTTGGYAPKFLTDWMKARRAAGEIVEQGGSLVLSDAHRQAVWTSLSKYID